MVYQTDEKKNVKGYDHYTVKYPPSTSSHQSIDDALTCCRLCWALNNFNLSSECLLRNADAAHCQPHHQSISHVLNILCSLRFWKFWLSVFQNTTRVVWWERMSIFIVGMVRYNFFMSDTDTATWNICRYRYQTDTFSAPLLSCS